MEINWGEQLFTSSVTKNSKLETRNLELNIATLRERAVWFFCCKTVLH